MRVGFDVKRVEHDDVEAPVCRGVVRDDVGPRGGRGGRRRHRHVHERKVGERLRLAVLGDDEVVAREAADDSAGLVGDHGVDLDSVGRRAENGLALPGVDGCGGGGDGQQHRARDATRRAQRHTVNHT